VAAFTWRKGRTGKTTDGTTDYLPNQQDQWVMTYEYRANTILRHSADGLNGSPPRELPLTGISQDWLMPCRPEGQIGTHPYTPSAYECLVGSPPGIYIDERIGKKIFGQASPPELFIFVGLGQNPNWQSLLPSLQRRRDPGLGDQAHTQFLLGLARSSNEAIDGTWELYPANPILLDLSGNVGVGHADMVMAQNGNIVETYLYTSLDGEKRSRLRLVWK
jgi:hypothetical protein